MQGTADTTTRQARNLRLDWTKIRDESSGLSSGATATYSFFIRAMHATRPPVLEFHATERPKLAGSIPPREMA